jgi:AcrR family transcriptional regulator
MRDVAVAAAIGQGTLYRNFRHKAALCEALLEDDVARFANAVSDRLEGEVATRSALELFRDFVDEMLGFIEESGALMTAMGDRACGAGPEARYQNPFPVWLGQTMWVLLDLAIARGEIQPLDVEATVDLILSACESNHYLYQRRQRGYSRARILASITGLLRRR